MPLGSYFIEVHVEVGNVTAAKLHLRDLGAVHSLAMPDDTVSLLVEVPSSDKASAKQLVAETVHPIAGIKGIY